MDDGGLKRGFGATFEFLSWIFKFFTFHSFTILVFYLVYFSICYVYTVFVLLRFIPSIHSLFSHMRPRVSRKNASP